MNETTIAQLENIKPLKDDAKKSISSTTQYVFNKDGSLRLAAIRRPVDANGVACPAATKPVITSTDKGGNTR